MSGASQDSTAALIVAGTVAALRKRVEAQRKIATDGSSVIDGHGSAIIVHSPESALATRIANDLDAIADEIGGAL
jgi:hypothetical protein